LDAACVTDFGRSSLFPGLYWGVEEAWVWAAVEGVSVDDEVSVEEAADGNAGLPVGFQTVIAVAHQTAHYGIQELIAVAS
jgi:hypothetical protein